MKETIFKWIRTLILGTVLAFPLAGLAGVAYSAETELPTGHNDAGPLAHRAGASVTIIAYIDFLSPTSAKGARFMNEVAKFYPDDIRIIVKPYPSLTLPHAILAHEAVLASGEQGKFWEMHDRLLTHKGEATEETILGYAKQLNLNLDPA